MHNGSERDGRGGRRSWSGKRSRPQHDLWRGRDGAKTLRREARRSFPFLERIIADAGDQGQRMEAVVARTGVWALQIVRRCDRPRFGVLPKRWIVERTLAWISRCRRLARDYERHARKAAAFVRLAMIRLRLRRLAARPRSKIQPSRIGSKSLPVRTSSMFKGARLSRVTEPSVRQLLNGIFCKACASSAPSQAPRPPSRSCYRQEALTEPRRTASGEVLPRARPLDENGRPK